MCKPFFLLLIIAGGTFLYSCNSEPAKSENPPASTFSLDSVKAAIAASNASFGNGFSTGDSVAFASHYTTDGCISPSNFPKMCGRAAIMSYFNGGYQMGIRGIRLTTDEVTGGKEGVIETGRYEVFADKNISIDKGKFVVVWKEEGGAWKMHRDIWNTDLPMATPAK
ncbi:MAG: hypothetical protein HZA79_04935 [Sphingobacteriales bacterium]|nr:hypothetical protein [Sphingobacteriales bacterium]